jgi:hypothetical protein
MFIGRNPDGTIYGLWTVRQWEGHEELPDNHPDVIAGPVRTAAQLVEAARRQEIVADATRIDLAGRLKMATATQIHAYVDTNVTDIATARALLKRILLLIALDARNGA